MKKYFQSLLYAHTLFTVFALVFGVIFVYLTPPLWGTDETSHFARVYQIAHGQILPNLNKANYGGKLPDNLVRLNDYVKSDLLDNKGGGVSNRKDVDSEAEYQQRTGVHFSHNQVPYMWTATYSPVAYLGAVIGTVIGDVFNTNIGTTLLLARFFSLVVYIVLIWLSLRILKDFRAKWIIFVVALLPISIFQASVVTADNITIGLSLLFVSTLLRLLMDRERLNNRVLLGILAITGVLLPLAKINYILLSFAVILVPNVYFGLRHRALLFKSAVSALAISLGLVWSKIISVTASAPVSQRPDGLAVDAARQMAWILHNPLHFIVVCLKTIITHSDTYVQELSGLIGWNYIVIPSIFLFLLLLAVVLAAFNTRKELVVIRLQLLILGGLSIIGIAGIFVAFYLAFNPIGFRQVDGVQGRYFIPFMVPFALLFASFIPIDLRIKERNAAYIFTTIALSSLLVSVLYYFLETY